MRSDGVAHQFVESFAIVVFPVVFALVEYDVPVSILPTPTVGFHEQGNTFNTVIMNVDWSNFHSDSAYSYPFSDYAFMPLMSEGWVADLYYDEVPLWNYATWRALPVMKYAEFNNKYPFWESIRNRNFEYERRYSLYVNGKSYVE